MEFRKGRPVIVIGRHDEAGNSTTYYKLTSINEFKVLVLGDIYYAWRLLLSVAQYIEDFY